MKLRPLSSDQLSEAFELLASKAAMPTELNTARGRAEFVGSIRDRNIIIAGAGNAEYVEEIKRAAGSMLSGGRQYKEIAALQRTLKALGYQAKPGDEGTMSDLAAEHRLRLILQTEPAMAQGKVNQMFANSPEQRRRAPAVEMIRGREPKVRRDWAARWKLAGGPPLTNGRFIAALGAGVWAQLGNHNLFPDALNTTWAPFWFGSTGLMRTVTTDECKSLGIMDAKGLWTDGYHPARTMGIVETALPAPILDTAKMEPSLAQRLTSWAKSKLSQAGAWFKNLFGGGA